MLISRYDYCTACTDCTMELLHPSLFRVAEVIPMRDWPVVVTNQCADACQRQFGLAHRDGARQWLYQVIDQRGKVTDQLPEPVARVRSSSGFFMVAHDVVVLPLAAASDGTARWIATDCKVFPTYQPRYRKAAGTGVDPYRLRGGDLVRHVHLSQNAVVHYQQRCDGDPDPMIAGEELREILARDGRAMPAPPAWCGTAGRADFYLVATDEYVLPMSRRGTRGYSFEALDCLHRAAELFALRGPDLAARCRYDGFAALPGRRDGLIAALRRGGQLSWRRPRWVRGYRSVRLWIIAGPRLAAPVVWQPADPDTPLLVLDVMERLSPYARVARWWHRVRRVTASAG